MTEALFPVAQGGDGNAYSADGSAARDMLNGGHRDWFVPALQQTIIMAQSAAASAVTAASGAASMTGTSSTSVTVGTGSKSFTASTGRSWVAGGYVLVFRTSVPSTYMLGRVTSYTSGTGALVVDVTGTSGSGTITDWTITTAGPQGSAGSVATMVGSALTTGTNLGTGDIGKFIRCTGTFTVTFTAAATLASGWWVWLKNESTGVITLDPNSSETINGAATYTLPANTAALVQCDGSAFRVIHAAPSDLVRLPIFSAAAAAPTACSAGERIENSLIETGLAASAEQLVWGNSLFLVGSAASAANIASSPDGTTWTLRAMPSTAAWNIGTDGTSKFVATVPGATTTANSTSGTTWSAATALPGAAKATYGLPVFVGSTCFVLSNTASTGYWSSDNGATWTSATLPSTSGSMAPFAVGSVFWYYNSGATAYTSATGATSSWTSRTLPVTPAFVVQDFDGALICAASNGSTYYRTTDGITWSALSVPLPLESVNSTVVRSINGVYMNLGIAGTVCTYHGTKWVPRASLANDSSNSFYRCAKNSGGTVFMIPGNIGSTGQVARIAPADSDAAQSLFTR